MSWAFQTATTLIIKQCVQAQRDFIVLAGVESSKSTPNAPKNSLKNIPKKRAHRKGHEAKVARCLAMIDGKFGIYQSSFEQSKYDKDGVSQKTSKPKPSLLIQKTP
jgi:hypothetical protein